MLIWYAVILGFVGLFVWPTLEPRLLEWTRQRRKRRELRAPETAPLPPLSQTEGLKAGVAPETQGGQPPHASRV